MLTANALTITCACGGSMEPYPLGPMLPHVVLPSGRRVFGGLQPVMPGVLYYRCRSCRLAVQVSEVEG